MDARQQNKGKVCSVAGCGRGAVAKGLCRSHYDRLRDHGSAEHVTVLMKTTQCTAEGCTALARQKGLCDRHYQRLRKYGDPNHVPAKVKDAACSVAGCTRQASTRGLCGVHYKAMLRHGDPTVRKKNSLRRPCAVDGCGSLTTRTYCNAHEIRFRRYGDATYKPPKISDSLCEVDGCDRPAFRGRLCRRHHRRTLGAGLRQMLSEDQLRYIVAQRGLVDPVSLAKQLGTAVSTIFAVQAGRDWGVIRDPPEGPASIGKQLSR